MSGPPFEAQQYWSQHAEYNALLYVPGLDVYKGPSCLMHSVDHGIFVKLLDLEVLLVKTAKGDSLADEFEERYALIMFDDASSTKLSCRWGLLLPFFNFRTFQGGIMHRSYVRAYEHRSMAVALPFVMHRLVPGEGGLLGEECAISFILWRNALDKHDYVEHDGPTTHVNVTSLETVERLGRKLQVDMNALKNYLSDVPDDEFEG